MSRPVNLSYDDAKFKFDYSFEALVLALCLRREEFLVQNWDAFKARWFSHLDLAVIARVVEKHFNRYEVVPSQETMTEEIKEHCERTEKEDEDVLAWLDHIYDGVELRDAESVRDKLLDFARFQAMKMFLTKTLDHMGEHERSENGAVLDMEQISDWFEAARDVGTDRDWGVGLGERTLEIAERSKNSIHGFRVRTGITSLDSLLNGGPRSGTLTVVAGPPNRGKSTLLTNMGVAAMNQFSEQGNEKTVFHITLELKEIDVELKYAARLSGVPINKILSGESERYREVLGDQLHVLADQPCRIKYFSPGTISVTGIKLWIRNICIAKDLEPGVVIVDYADELEGADIDSYYKMGKIYSELIAMGDTFNCPVFTGSQINREWSHEELIDERGTSDSWKKVAKADNLIVMCQTRKELKQGVMRLYQAKVRRGAKGTISYCHWRGDLAAIWEMSDDEIRALQDNDGED